MDKFVAKSKSQELVNRYSKKETVVKLTKSTITLGYYKRVYTGPDVIGLSTKMVETNEWSGVEQVVLHEIAHMLCPSGVHHGPQWVAKAKELGMKNPSPYLGLNGEVAPLTRKHRWDCTSCDGYFTRDKLHSKFKGTKIHCGRCHATMEKTR